MTPGMKDVLDAYRGWSGVPNTPLWLEMLLVLASTQADEIERLSGENVELREWVRELGDR